MKELSESIQKELQSTQQKIQAKTKSIKSNLKELLSLIGKQSINMDLLKEQNKSKAYPLVSDLLSITPMDAQTLHKTYKSLSNKNVIDKNCLESVGILNRPLAKSHKKLKRKSNSNTIIEMGTIIGKIRGLNEQHNLSDEEKIIFKEFAKQLQGEL